MVKSTLWLTNVSSFEGFFFFIENTLNYRDARNITKPLSNINAIKMFHGDLNSLLTPNYVCHILSVNESSRQSILYYIRLMPIIKGKLKVLISLLSFILYVSFTHACATHTVTFIILTVSSTIDIIIFIFKIQELQHTEIMSLNQCDEVKI